MTRSPLFYPLNRGADAEAGGVSDLQTDVMRFMAILALCLVAIFALVQSIPLAPQSPPPAEEAQPVVQAAPPAETTSLTDPVPPVEQNISLTRPQPKKPAREDVPTVLQRPPVAAAAEMDTSPVKREAPKEGFTLRFEDHVALTRLVARDEVGLYAILPDKSWRMNVNRGQFSFWPASLPKQFHEMDEQTVPDAVTLAFRQSGAPRTQQPRWGVTIPSATSQQLERYLREETGGELVIDAAGALRLE